MAPSQPTWAQLGQCPAGAPFAAYYNMDMQDLDVELGFPVPKELPGKDEIKAGHLPGGKYAVVLHTGPYDQVGPAYEALAKWVAEKGYQATGVAYEVYLNDPGQTKPEDLQTQVMFPLNSERPRRSWRWPPGPGRSRRRCREPVGG